MHLILIGFPGVGKTTLGKEVASRLGLPFVDTDDLVGDPRKAFEEGTLRQKEAEALASLAGGTPHVIATGGGIVLAPYDLKSLGWVVYLQAALTSLEQRVKGSRTCFQGKPLAEMAAHRFPLYEALADTTIATDLMTTKEIASMICERWATHSAIFSVS